MFKLQEFQTLKSSGYITVPFSVVWSQDNFIAHLTDRGVNVFELRFSGLSKESSIVVKRWFIKPHQFFPTYDCMINVHKLGETLHPDQLFQLVVDRTLSPKACLSGNTIHPISVAWAPFSRQLSDTSLLTILGDQGSLDIYTYGEDNWQHSCCVSEYWLAIVSKRWDNDNSKHHTHQSIFEELRVRTYSTRITAFSWGKCHEDKWWSLFTGNQSGELMQWKVEVVNNRLTVSQILIIRTDLDSVITLHSLSLEKPESYMVLMGCWSGKMQCIVVNKGEQKNKTTVWSDQDQMPVPLNGVVGTYLPEGILYLVPKLGHLLFFWLDSDANLINFSTYSTNDICVSGIAWVKDYEFIVSTRSGEMLSVNVELDSFSLTVNVESCEPLSKTNGCSYHGIAYSHNKCIMAIPYSVCAPHDPSVLKEPTSLGLFQNLDNPHNPSFYLSLEANSFFDLWDCLHLFRVENGGCKDLEDLTEDEIYKNLEGLDILQLKKLFWIKRYRLNLSEDPSSTWHTVLDALCEELKRSIISHYLFMRVKDLISKKEIGYSKEEEHSLVCAKMWLTNYSVNGILKSYRKKAEILVQTLKPLGLVEKENCPHCDSECQALTSKLIMACEKGHKMFRCPRTLLPIEDTSYFICFYCTEITSIGTGENKICILCDAPLRANKLLFRN